MRNNPRAVEARSKRSVDADKFKKALDAFLAALEIDEASAFEINVGPSQAVVKHVQYTQKDNGTMSGDFWTEVVSRGDRGRND